MNQDLFKHTDPLKNLNGFLSASDKLDQVHQQLIPVMHFISRVAVALYDEKTDLLKTFIASSVDNNPLVYYDAPLAHSRSLQAILENGKPRVVNDMSIFKDNGQLHSRALEDKGYRSSYTLPIIHRGRLLGFLFFNSYEPNSFTEDKLPLIDVYGHLISSIVINELNNIHMLINSLRTAIQVVKEHDPETGNHLERVSYFSRMIAQELARRGKYPFTDQYIEYLSLFAPLHDLGKIVIPNEILKKPDKLSQAEFEVMKTHTLRGEQMVDMIARNVDFETFEFLELARNIPKCHHETMDGLGYPQGLEEDQIPIEARIVAVADVFDALTHERVYKHAWSDEEAFAEIAAMRGGKLDPDCVDAFMSQREKIKIIREQFSEEV